MGRDEILEVLRDLGIAKSEKQGNNVQIRCPFAQWRKGHKSAIDRKPSFGIMVNEEGDSVVHCYSCGYTGDLASMVLDLHARVEENLMPVYEKVLKMEELDPEYLASTVGEYDQEVVEELWSVPESYIEGMLGRTHRYVLARGIELETLKAWGAGFDREKKRALFPVRRSDGVLVGAVGRAVYHWQEPRYLNYFGIKTGSFLYGEHMVTDQTALVIVEGLFDALSVWQAIAKAGKLEKYSVSALFGAQATAVQKKRIIQFTDEVVDFMDDDPAGWTGKEDLARWMSKKGVLTRGVRYPTELINADPAKLVKKGYDVVSLIENADAIIA